MSQLAETFGKLGVTNDSHIILYQAANSFTATARVYLTLDAMGLGAQTSVLDGGFLQWTKEGRAVSTESRKVKAGVVTPCPEQRSDHGYFVREREHASFRGGDCGCAAC